VEKEMTGIRVRTFAPASFDLSAIDYDGTSNLGHNQ
jgi:hypothetical protein